MRDKHLNQFTGVINADVDPHLLPPGDYIDGLNIIHGVSGVQGAVENPLGTSSVTFAKINTGTKTVVGTVEDKQYQRLYYFVYNATNNALNQIVRWDPKDSVAYEVAEGTAIGLSVERRVQGVCVDGKYLYYTDGRVVDGVLEGNEPKKINVYKGVRDDRNLNAVIYADINDPAAFANGNTFLIRVRNTANTQVEVTTFTADGTYEGDYAGGLLWLKTSIEADALDAYMNVELCGECKLEIEMINPGYTVEMTTSDDDAILVAEDYYPINLETWHVSLVKQPPSCAPVPTYIKDGTTSINNVVRGCFQFRCRYIYDDGEKSAWGPISQVAQNLNIDGTANEYLNAIDIDFTEANKFTDPQWMCIIRGVEIAVRDGNDGLWKLIKTLDYCDVGIKTNKYTWLNDKVYSVIPSDDPSQGRPDLQVLKLFDNVPLIAGTVETITGTDSDQRVVLGDIQEGLECIECPVVEITSTDYPGDDCLVDIIGTVSVWNSRDDMEIDPDYRDYALEGFVVYLAGTNFYAISNNPADGSGDGSFRIKGVPKGRYTLRVAAPYCRFDDVNGSRHNLNNSLEWQKTSAPVVDCAGSVAATGYRAERYLDLVSAVNEFDLDTEVGYGEIRILNGYYSTSDGLLDFYFLDNSGLYLTGDDRIGAIGIERMLIEVSIGVGVPVEMETDHNGYAFIFRPSGGGAGMNLLTVGDLTSSFYMPLTPGDWSLAFDDSGAIFGPQTLPVTGLSIGGSSRTFLFFNDSPAWTTAHRRTVSGRCEDTNGFPVAGALLVLSAGRFTESGYDGNYQITMYPYNDGVTPLARVDTVSSTYLNDVCAEYLQTPAFIVINVGTWDNETGVDFVWPFVGGLAYVERVLKKGANYGLGVVYEDDAARTCGVTVLGEGHVPFFTENETFEKQSLQVSIYHQPPVWAKRYKVVRTKNTTHRSYFQWVTDEVRFGIVTSPASDPVFVPFANPDWTHFFIKVNIRDIPGVDTGLLLFFQEALDGYTAQVGDRVRFITDADNNFINPGSILELDVAGRFIEDENYFVVVPRISILTEPEAGWLFEFYTPKGVDELFYYETGQCYDVANPGEASRAHVAPIQTQDPFTNQPAIFLIEGGDTYWRQRLFNTVGGAGVTIELENKTMTAYHNDPCEDIGRAFAEVEYLPIWNYNRIRFSSTYTPGSLINGLSSFGALDYQDLNRQFGPIIGLKYVGNILLAVCQQKAQSIYVGKGRMLDLRGQESVGRSDQILNVANESIADAGCLHPESIVENNGRVYWWDIVRGRVWRYSQAGVEPIDAGLYENFQTIANTRKNISRETDFCPAGFDRYLGLYILTFNAGTYPGPEATTITVAGVTWAFHEAKQGWTTRFSFNSPAYGMVNNEFIGFSSAAVLYRHNKNTTCNLFYAVAYLSELKFAVNPIPQAVKDWHCISVHTDKKWAAPAIEIPANLNYKSGMLSRLKVNKWNSYEGIWCADFLGDMYDTSAVYLAIADLPTRYATALQKGRRLKGNVLIITLQSADTAGQQFKLWETTTEYSISHKTSV